MFATAAFVGLRLNKFPYHQFLAPTGAQEMQMFVRLSVYVKLVSNSQSASFCVQILHDDFRMTSGRLREH